jgi:hypothetical protein
MTKLATSTVEKFEGLDDASFDSMTEVFAAMLPMTMKKKKMEEEAMMMKKKASEDNSVESEVLETAETEETIDLSVGNEETASEVENTRAALVDFVYNRLGKKLNKLIAKFNASNAAEKNILRPQINELETKLLHINNLRKETNYGLDDSMGINASKHTISFSANNQDENTENSITLDRCGHIDNSSAADNYVIRIR